MIKSELRAEYKRKRSLLNPEAVSVGSQQLADRFFADEKIQQSLINPDAVLHTFLPIRRQNEIDTWLIIKRVWADFAHVRVLSSLTNADTKTMLSFDLTPTTVLVENRWGIPEPVSQLKPVLQPPTLVLVPLLAFDLVGHRVGYGGGYYDRFLTGIGPQCLRLGLSYFEPVESIDDVQATDVALHGCIYSAGIYWA